MIDNNFIQDVNYSMMRSDYFSNKTSLSHLSSIFTRFNDSCDSIWRSNTHLICPNKFLSFSSIKLLSNTLSLMGKVNGIRGLNNTSTFPSSLSLHSPVVTNLIMTQSTPVKTIPYITSSRKASLYVRFFYYAETKFVTGLHSDQHPG